MAWRLILLFMIPNTLAAIEMNVDQCGEDFCYPPSSNIMALVKSFVKQEIIPWQTGRSLNAYFGFYVESLSNFRTTDMSFDMDMYARLSWVDERLMHNSSIPYLLIDLADIEQIWKPDVYFANAKKSTFQSVTEPNRSLRIYKDGSIHYSARVTLTLSCNQDLRKYPMDTQQCHVRTLSWSHTVDRLQISWFDDPIQWNPDIELPEMQVLSMQPSFCNGTYRYGETANTYMIGNFSCLLATIFLRREIGYHLVQTYIPTGLIVIISWVSFLIDPTAIPARISLSFTTLLTLSTMAAGVRVSLPPVSYAKAIDMWMGVCMGFVFLGLLEFALVNSMLRTAKKLEEPIPQAKKIAESIMTDLLPDQDVHEAPVKKRSKSNMNPLLNTNRNRKAVSKFQVLSLEEKARLRNDYKRKVRCIEKLCAIFFPLSFVFFNMAYWCYYLAEY